MAVMVRVDDEPSSFELSGVRSADADGGFASAGKTLLATGFEVGASAATASTRGEAVGGVDGARGEAVGGVNKTAPSVEGKEGTFEVASEGLPL